MDEYVIFECSNTLRLFRWGREAYGLWIPLRRLPDGSIIAAMPGYAFAPQGGWRGLLGDPRRPFRLRPFGYDDYGDPKTCPREQLVAMQTAINEAAALGRPQPAPEPRDWKLGERVRMKSGPFAGIEAVVEKVRQSSIRIVTRKGFMSVPPEILESLN